RSARLAFPARPAATRTRRAPRPASIRSRTSSSRLVFGTKRDVQLAPAAAAVGAITPPVERANGLNGLRMTSSVEALWQLADVELLGAYDDARRRFAEKKFARDTQRARLEWLRAKAFAAATGGVSERRSAIDASEDLARKGQELREMTRDLDLIKVEVDVIAMIARLRGAAVATEAKAEEPSEGEDSHEGR